MSKVKEIKDMLSGSDYETIEDLASKNYAPSDIALALSVSKRTFKHIWKDKNSQIREAYECGRLDIAIAKADALEAMINEGNVTAYQIHDKNAKAQAFEDFKNEIFGF